MNTNSRTAFIVVFLLSLAASSCGGERSAQPTTTPAGVPTSSPAPTIIVEPSPTSTPSYTQTPEISPTPTLGVGSRQASSNDGMVLVYVPEGDFVMGSDDPGYASPDYSSDQHPILNTAHTVWLDAYWIDRTEITNAMYQTCVESGGCTLALGSTQNKFNGSEQPVVSVTWYQAEAYCEWAGRRLPTEAEWEKAARGLTGKPFPWGDGSDDARRANFLYIGKDAPKYLGRTADVGSYPRGASPYGALDMAGNAYEWVADWFSAAYYEESPARNPQGPDSRSGLKVLRGGSWMNNGVNSIDRYMNYPDLKDPLFHFGFRCAVSQ